MLNKFSLGNTHFTQELKLPTRKIVAFTEKFTCCRKLPHYFRLDLPLRLVICKIILFLWHQTLRIVNMKWIEENRVFYDIVRCGLVTPKTPNSS